jgi:hypothetical protein
MLIIGVGESLNKTEYLTLLGLIFPDMSEIGD